MFLRVLLCCFVVFLGLKRVKMVQNIWCFAWKCLSLHTWEGPELLFCCSSLPLLTKKNTALCQAMCQKTSLKGSHEKRKYQFCTKAKDERQKPLAFSLQIGGESNKATLEKSRDYSCGCALSYSTAARMNAPRALPSVCMSRSITRLTSGPRR